MNNDPDMKASFVKRVEEFLAKVPEDVRKQILGASGKEDLLSVLADDDAILSALNANERIFDNLEKQIKQAQDPLGEFYDFLMYCAQTLQKPVASYLQATIADEAVRATDVVLAVRVLLAYTAVRLNQPRLDETLVYEITLSEARDSMRSTISKTNAVINALIEDEEEQASAAEAGTNEQKG